MASPDPSLASVNVPSEVPPLNASMLAVNGPGTSDWSSAPAPITPEAKVTVTGPLPPPKALVVQSKESPAVKPAPFQLQFVDKGGARAQTTETTLLAPARVTVALRP